MEFKAQARYMRVTPQKARLVLDLIKGRRVEDALNTLIFTKKRVAATVEKLLRSALQNANYLSSEKGIDVDVDTLYVKSAIANDGPRMKRIRPAPMGRAFRYVRRISHIELVLAERGHKDGESLATVVGEESAHPAKAPARTKSSATKHTHARAKGKAKTDKSKSKNKKKTAAK
jgi:large subunit ribosomal protein L22